jgi:hypothetical protein
MIGTLNSVDASHYDSREYDIRSCSRLFANCASKTPTNGLVLGNMNLSIPTSSGGTVALSAAYNAGAAQLYQMSIPQSSGLRVSLTDRVAATSQTLWAGMFEMDTTARVRWNKTGQDDTMPKIGFCQYSASVASIIAFTCTGTETTWRVHIAITTNDNGSLVIEEKRINTGVSISDWTTLHVWVDQDGKHAKFYANGRLVYHERDPLWIPRADNHKYKLSTRVDADWNPEIVTNYADSLNNGGVTLRGTQNNASPATFDVDWVRIRYFTKR